MTRHYTQIEAAEADRNTQQGNDNVVDLAQRRAPLDDRFPQVDDILDRLTMDMQSMVRTVGGSDVTY